MEFWQHPFQTKANYRGHKNVSYSDNTGRCARNDYEVMRLARRLLVPLIPSVKLCKNSFQGRMARVLLAGPMRSASSVVLDAPNWCCIPCSLNQKKLDRTKSRRGVSPFQRYQPFQCISINLSNFLVEKTRWYPSGQMRPSICSFVLKECSWLLQNRSVWLIRS